jgi:type VI secretion system secreted protein VgrG
LDALPGEQVSLLFNAEESGDQNDLSGVVESAAIELIPSPHGDTGYFVHLTIVPRLAVLRNTKRYRIFHEQSPETVVRTILKEGGVSKFKMELRSGWVSERPYIVQYRDSDFDVVTRLLAERGLAYYFWDETLCVMDGVAPADHVIGLRFMPVAQEFVYPADVVHGLTLSRVENCGSVSSFAYDEMKSAVVTGTASFGSSPWTIGFEEHYGQTFIDKQYGDAVSRFRLEGINSLALVLRGHTYSPHIFPGVTIEISGSPIDLHNGRFVVISINLHIHQLPADPGIPLFRCSFEAIPEGIPFRPVFACSKNRIYGCQTAIVVGTSGEEIFCDEGARVKVRFHWDSSGQGSCWVRVAQGWAGNGFGSLIIPRVGMEVMVAFMDGDPEQPIIVGCLYNGVNKPPADYPKSSPTVSAFFTSSSKGGGGSSELRFEDKKGEEEVHLHCLGKLSTLVSGINSGDEPTTYAIEVAEGNHSLTLWKGDYEITIDEGNQFVRVKSGSYTFTLSNGDLIADVKGNISLSASGDITMKAQGAVMIESSGKVLVDSKDSVFVTAMQDIKFDAKTGFEVSCLTCKMNVTTTVTISGLGIKIEAKITMEFTSAATTVIKASMVQFQAGVTAVQGVLKIG